MSNGANAEPSKRLGCLRLIVSDYRSFSEFRGDSARKRRLLMVPRMLVNPSLHAVVIIRLSNGSPRWLHWFWRNLMIWKHSMDVGYRPVIGPGLFMPHPFGIAIGPGVVIGANVRISHNVDLGPNLGSAGVPVIGDGTIILPRASVLGDLEVGAKAVVGVAALVVDDVPPGGVASAQRATISGPPVDGTPAAEQATLGRRIGTTRAEQASRRISDGA